MYWKLNNPVVAAIIVLTLAAPTFAEQSPAAQTDDTQQKPAKCRHHPEFSEFDLDQNGSITQEEFNLAHAERFKERAAEGRKLKNVKPLPEMFAKIDADGDKTLSRQEFEAHRADKAHHCGHHQGRHQGRHKQEL